MEERERVGMGQWGSQSQAQDMQNERQDGAIVRSAASAQEEPDYMAPERGSTTKVLGASLAAVFSLFLSKVRPGGCQWSEH